MKKLNLNFLILVALTFVFCSPTFAQQPVSAEKQALIREFLEASGGQKTANKMVEVMISFQEQEMPKRMSSMVDLDKKLTSAQRQELKQMTVASAERSISRFRQFFTQRVNIGQILEEISLPIYDKHFTAGELRDLIAFYRTPTGQKLIEISPKMTMEAMLAFSEKFTPKMEEFMKETAAAELAELKQKLRSTGNGRKPVRKS
jgi:hypothetical protein